MSLRGALLAAVVLGLAGLGLVAWIGSQLPSKPRIEAVAAPAPPPVSRVLVASRALHSGSLLKYDDIESRDVPVPEVPAGARIDSQPTRGELIGSMVRRDLRPQEILLPADLLWPGDHGFLASVLQPGMRATTVAVDAVSGSAGLIWPGDHVDVILTQVTDDRSLPAARRASAETVMGDVRVIAIDQQLMQGTTATTTERGATHTVTLEVTDTQAEWMALGARLGHISLIVRAAETAGPAAPRRSPTTWGGDVSPALNQGAPTNRMMRIYQGTSEGKEVRF